MTSNKYTELVEQIRHKYAFSKEKIEQNDKWTPQARADQLRELAEQSNAQIQKLRQQLADERESRIKVLEQKLFSVDDNAAMLSYRDGIARATATETPEQLQDMLTQATETNDLILAKATAYVAQKSGNFDIAAQAFSGSNARYFEEYLSMQSALAHPVSREALEESFLFAALG